MHDLNEGMYEQLNNLLFKVISEHSITIQTLCCKCIDLSVAKYIQKHDVLLVNASRQNYAKTLFQQFLFIL